jgi:hypothetical protein
MQPQDIGIFMSQPNTHICKECGKSYSAACQQCHIPRRDTPKR